MFGVDRSEALRRALLLAPGLSMLALSACQTVKPAPERAGVSVSMEEEPEWRGVATPEDLGRIERLSGAWSEALADARRAAFRARSAAKGIC